jgi:hypothetical protein
MKTRPISLIGLVLAAAATAAAQCHASPKENKESVPWAASAGEIQWTATNPYDCKVDKSVPWMVVSVMPPTTASVGVLRYSIDTNLSSAARTGSIQLGDATVEISQAAGPKPGMAFSPGRIELQFAPSPQAPKEITKTLFVGSEEPLPFSAKLAEPSEWLTITSAPAGSAPQRQQRFVVTVKTDKLKPGANKANIQLEAAGASNSKEMIPVVVQVGDGK